MGSRSGRSTWSYPRAPAHPRGEPGDGIWAECGPEDVTVVSHSNPAVIGRTLADVASGADPFDTACELAVADAAAGMVVESMAEPDVREILASPLVGVGSDSGVPGPGPVHPRTAGTYPRLLGRYVRELGVLDLAEAVRKATSLVARRFRLHGRGTMVEGSWADVVAFDPDLAGHAGTVTDPYAPVTGIHTVLLEGEPVVVDGAFTGDGMVASCGSGPMEPGRNRPCGDDGNHIVGPFPGGPTSTDIVVAVTTTSSVRLLAARLEPTSWSR